MVLQRAGRLPEGQGGVDLALLLPTQRNSSSSSGAGAGSVRQAYPPSSLDAVAAATEGYSGSDLMELAAQVWGRGSARVYVWWLRQPQLHVCSDRSMHHASAAGAHTHNTPLLHCVASRHMT
jgi:hypothetical protein